jgi:lysophospholipase L1-like esterase
MVAVVAALGVARVALAVALAVAALVGWGLPCADAAPLVGRWEGAGPDGLGVAFDVRSDIRDRRYVLLASMVCDGFSNADPAFFAEALAYPIKRDGQIRAARVDGRRVGPPIRGRLGRQSATIRAYSPESAGCPNVKQPQVVEVHWTQTAPVPDGLWRVNPGDPATRATFRTANGGKVITELNGVLPVASYPGPPLATPFPLPCPLIGFSLPDALVRADGSFTALRGPADKPDSWSGRFTSATSAEGEYSSPPAGTYCARTAPFVARLESQGPAREPVLGGRPLPLLPLGPSRPLVYVTLGDSYSSGEGGRPFIGDSGGRGGCHRSTRAYSQVFRLDGFTFARQFYACSQATADNVGWLDPTGALTGTVQAAAGQLQLDLMREGTTAQTPDLVTLTLGGNDAGFTDALKTCVLRRCDRGAVARRLLDRILVDTGPKVERTLDAIRRLAPKATVIALGYPRLFPETGEAESSCLATKLPRQRQLFLNRLATALRDVLASTAAAGGVH